VVFRVPVEGEARNRHETKEGRNQLNLVNSQIQWVLCACACIDLPANLPTDR
jgi:hypothetical protein